MSQIAYPHVRCADDGTAMIEGTQTKVVEIVLDRLVHHWDADEIQRQHPDLSLAQIHAALGYYHDHEEELNRVIEERLRREERILRELGDSRIRAKLQAARRAS